MDKKLVIRLAKNKTGPGYIVINKIELIREYRDMHVCSLYTAKKDIYSIVEELEFFSKEAKPDASAIRAEIEEKIRLISDDIDGAKKLQEILKFVEDYKKNQTNLMNTINPIKAEYFKNL